MNWPKTENTRDMLHSMVESNVPVKNDIGWYPLFSAGFFDLLKFSVAIKSML